MTNIFFADVDEEERDNEEANTFINQACLGTIQEFIADNGLTEPEPKHDNVVGLGTLFCYSQA